MSLPKEGERHPSSIIGYQIIIFNKNAYYFSFNRIFTNKTPKQHNKRFHCTSKIQATKIKFLTNVTRSVKQNRKQIQQKELNVCSVK